MCPAPGVLLANASANETRPHKTTAVITSHQGALHSRTFAGLTGRRNSDLGDF